MFATDSLVISGPVTPRTKRIIKDLNFKVSVKDVSLSSDWIWEGSAIAGHKHLVNPTFIIPEVGEIILPESDDIGNIIADANALINGLGVLIDALGMPSAGFVKHNLKGMPLDYEGVLNGIECLVLDCEASEIIRKEVKEMARTAKKSPFKTGKAKVGSGGSARGTFLTLKEDGASQVFAPLVGLDEMIYGDMHERWDSNPAVFHVCIGPNCPSCAVGHKTKFKGYVPIALPEGEVKVWAFTISIYNQLVELEKEMEDGTLRGKAIKLIRKGVGMATRWIVMGTGREIDIEDIEVLDLYPLLGPTDRDEIVKALLEAGLEVPGESSDSWGDDL